MFYSVRYSEFSPVSRLFYFFIIDDNLFVVVFFKEFHDTFKRDVVNIDDAVFPLNAVYIGFIQYIQLVVYKLGGLIGFQYDILRTVDVRYEDFAFVKQCFEISISRVGFYAEFGS